MNFLEFNIEIQPNEEYIFDLLSAYLAEFGFESFEKKDNYMLAYIDSEKYDQDKFIDLMKNFEFAKTINYNYIEIEQRNWNEEWEKNFFEPIVIGDECLIHSTFHKDLPNAKYDIIIDPKMSFGTGHHETTSLMIGEILKIDFADKSVLDMGCGTAVLAILAAKKGAKDITAIDIDTWCVENSLENIDKNNTSHIKVLLGDADTLAGKSFNIILANINRNILLNDIKKYVSCMNEGDEIYMSGFYVEDIPAIENEALKHNLHLVDRNEKNRWVVVKFVKKT
ncbi:MAG: ribosomal protein L11 methyltransferase [Bacteroidales bacterium 36-12]|nr:MAG: ribosomal protein L11 methyltransferase [Bacteroidales bacterium 36-12]